MGITIKILLALLVFNGALFGEVLDDSDYFKKKDWVRDVTKKLNENKKIKIIIGEFCFQENFGRPLYKDKKSYQKDKLDKRKMMASSIEEEFLKRSSGLAFLLRNLPKGAKFKFHSADNVYWNLKEQRMEPFTLWLELSIRDQH